MRRIYLVSLAMVSLNGCSNLMTPGPTIGWEFRVGTPSLVNVPLIATQQSGDVAITSVGTHVPQETTQPAQPMTKAKSDVSLPLPRLVKPTSDPCNPCPE